MSRFLLLLIFLIWLAWRSQGPAGGPPPVTDLGIFFGLFIFMIAMLGGWSRLLARRVHRTPLDRAARYFNRVVFAARFFVPVWFALGTFLLGWGDWVQWMLRPIASWPVQLPGALIGTLPAIGAWAGLWWSQYPADQALREQSLLVRLDNNLTIFRPPTFRGYLLQNVRLQILFTAVPILIILLLHDVAMLSLWKALHWQVESSTTEGVVTFASAVLVFIWVPRLLVRILPTEPMPACELRSRMQAMCDAHRMKFREILIWKTDHRIANALVMGIAPALRYVLLSDLLLAEMSPEQVEAVFAHELGHAVHRHMIWYLVFLKVLIVALAVLTIVLEAPQWVRWLPAWMPQDLLMTLIGFIGFLLAFGYVSRRFERQADVFAARTMENIVRSPAAEPGDSLPAEGESNESRPAKSHVGPRGAALFASALRKVALINNMPLFRRGQWRGGPRQRLGYLLELVGDATGNWLHGSIPSRMQILETMSADPIHTRRFDRRMRRLYAMLLIALLLSVFAAWRIRMPI